MFFPLGQHGYTYAKLKNMKKTISLMLLILLCKFSIAQKHVTTYYDYNKIHPHQDYYVNAAGQKNGAYKEYNENGVVVTECNYVNGLASGVCSTYWADEHNQRTLAGKATYKNSELNGPYSSYFQDGTPKESGNYLNGKKEGKWTVITELTDNDIPNPPSGFKYIKSSVDLKNDEPVTTGTVKVYYYPSGKLYREFQMKDGQSLAAETIYYPNGNIKKEVKADSSGKFYVSIEQHYSSGKLHSYQTYYNYDFAKPNTWMYVDTMQEYNEDGTPTDNMQHQAPEYEKNNKELLDWKAKVTAKYPTAKRTPDGLYYIIDAEGTGALPKPGQTVVTNYTMTLFGDSKKLDSSADRGQPDQFRIGENRYIAGLEEGLGLLKVGSKAKLMIPSWLGHGSRKSGDIPPNSDLIYDVEIVGIRW